MKTELIDVEQLQETIVNQARENRSQQLEANYNIITGDNLEELMALDE